MEKRGIRSRLAEIIDAALEYGLYVFLALFLAGVATYFIALLGCFIYAIERYALWPFCQRFGDSDRWIALATIHSPIAFVIVAAIIIGDDSPGGNYGSQW